MSLRSLALAAALPLVLSSAPALHVGGATIDGHGARLDGIALGLARVGREGALRPVRAAAPVRSPDGVRAKRGAGITEWWRMAGGRLEHLVTIDDAPAGADPLVLELALTGAVAVPSDDPDRVSLVDPRTALPRAVYEHLVVMDADARRLPARLVADADVVRIEIEDRGARYPIVVDPTFYGVEEATLVDPTAPEFVNLGSMVACSDDASTVFAGGSGTPARVFERDGAGYSVTSIPSSTGGSAPFVFATTALGDRFVTVGGGLANVRVFARGGSGWSEEALLAQPCADSGMGRSGDIDADGTLIVLGAPRCGGNVGAVAVYRRDAGGWALTDTLPSPVTTADRFGEAVALSDDGLHLAVTASSGASSVRLYGFDGTSFVLEQTFPGATFSTRLSMNADGTRLAVGGSDVVRVVERTASAWTEVATLTDPMGTGHSFGGSVSLSDDGALLVVGSEYAGPSLSVVGTAYLYARDAGSWVLEGELLGSSRDAFDRFGGDVSMAGDAVHAVIGVPSDDIVGSSEGSVRLFRLATLEPIGVACTDAGQCESGFCVDGVCCESACGGDDADCQACAGSLTGLADGACGALQAGVAETVTCREDAGACDVAEQCVAGEVACPDDGFVPMGVVCRASAAACDAAEACTGAGPACPRDALEPSGVVCRATTGACDPAERCDGTTSACPGDVLSPAGTECGGRLPGSCTSAGVCSGSSGACGGGTSLPLGTVCAPRDPANTCDVDDVCDGAGVCLERWAEAATVCGDGGGAGPCDAPDHCQGMTGECVDAFLIDVECRGSSGACDPAETCSGDGPACPADRFAAEGLVCRSSSASCDPEEACDGVTAGCPADQTTCTADAGTPDAGVGDAARSDAGGPAPVAGCACAAGPRSAPPALLLLALVVLARRRRKQG